MTRVAILDDVIPSQVRENPEDFGDLELAWAGSDPEQLRQQLPRVRPAVLVLSLDLLGSEPVERVRELRESAPVKLSLVLYQYAKRELIRDLMTRAEARPVKAPVSLRSLRGHMTSVIVQGILQSGGYEESKPEPPVPQIATQKTLDRRFSRAQLGRLQEIESAVECECPNHISQILLALTAFEDYSKDCENKSDEDARIHGLLYRQTADARRTMEEALGELIKHENIVL
jgi:hypothetical protein